MSTNPARAAAICLIGALVALTGMGAPAQAQPASDLWLHYAPVEQRDLGRYREQASGIAADCTRPTLRVACDELRRGLTALLARPIGIHPLRRARSGDVVLLSGRGPAQDGYAIRTGAGRTTIGSRSDVGLLYGTFAFLRLIQTRRPIAPLAITSTPTLPLRMLDHWDNLDGTVERGYAGPSLWDWSQLPRIDQRLIDYARANASVGINAVVLNNVNADARILTPEYLRKAAALANAWRPYGIRVFLSARFSAPIDIGGLRTADPLDPCVRDWWRGEADVIYRLIPDFGGFLVKASSEGQPGPQTYRRSHADGANMLAAALAPHGGTLIWRAFVYSGGASEDRANQAFDEFAPLDGKFAPNVILQVKNGPIDFQPREPFHPLFGAMPHTRLAMEVQLTREYLGENAGIVYLAPLWSEVMRSRTARPAPASEVRATLSAIAGVANIGAAAEWTGSDFDQANWYAYGRLAWDPAADPREIAENWTRQSWGNDRSVVKAIVAMTMRSREATVDAMTPLGLAHQMATDHHYGPGPWIADLPTPMWNPAYYNGADRGGIGFDRTGSGSNAVARYAPAIASCLADPRCVPESELLWFHHLPWAFRLSSGETVWTALVRHYDRGVAGIAEMNRTWSTLRARIGSPRFARVARSLDRQLAEARWWRDASVAYFQSLSGLPLPAGSPPPAHSLSWYKAVHFDTVQGFLKPRIGACRPSVVVRGGPPCAP